VVDRQRRIDTEDRAMPLLSRRILIGYLLLLAIGLIYLLASLASADFPEGGIQVATPSASPPVATAGTPSPDASWPLVLQTNCNPRLACGLIFVVRIL
jgi:hypothetical protein